jgi:hypothetical protein
MFKLQILYYVKLRVFFGKIILPEAGAATRIPAPALANLAAQLAAASQHHLE